MQKIVKKTSENKPSRGAKITKDSKTGTYRVKPDSRDFRGGFQPKSGSSKMPLLPKSGSAIRVVVYKSDISKGKSKKES